MFHEIELIDNDGEARDEVVLNIRNSHNLKQFEIQFTESNDFEMSEDFAEIESFKIIKHEEEEIVGEEEVEYLIDSEMDYKEDLQVIDGESLDGEIVQVGDKNFLFEELAIDEQEFELKEEKEQKPPEAVSDLMSQAFEWVDKILKKSRT